MLWPNRGINWEGGVFSFHTKQVDACENGPSFHIGNSTPPTLCILDLGCTRAMGSRKAVDALCSHVDSHPNSGLWYEVQPTSSRCFFANSQQSKCTDKIVIFMYDHGWNAQFTEFDIVKEGDVPYQNICQIECQIECQNICQIGCQIECQNIF